MSAVVTIPKSAIVLPAFVQFPPNALVPSTNTYCLWSSDDSPFNFKWTVTPALEPEDLTIDLEGGNFPEEDIATQDPSCLIYWTVPEPCIFL